MLARIAPSLPEFVGFHSVPALRDVPHGVINCILQYSSYYHLNHHSFIHQYVLYVVDSTLVGRAYESGAMWSNAYAEYESAASLDAGNAEAAYKCAMILLWGEDTCRDVRI